MADEWLSASQVAAIAQHAASPEPWGAVGLWVVQVRQDRLDLLAQDGRWRALVGELLAALKLYPDAHHPGNRVHVACRAAQAALDGAA